MRLPRHVLALALPALMAATLTGGPSVANAAPQRPAPVGVPPAAAPARATVSVDADDVLHKISPRLVGVHVPAWNETAFKDGRADPRLLREMRRLGFSYLVFPGGAFGLDYNWREPNVPTEMTTDQFLRLAKKVNATTKISVNPSASPRLAADWIRHTNRGRGADVRYWEVVDEPYLHMSADEFIAKMREFVPVMKRADRSIKIVTNITATDPAFSKKVIEEVGELTDVWSIHFFPLSPSQKIRPDSPYTADDKAAFYRDLLRSPQKLAEQLATVRSWVRDAHPDARFEYQIGSWAPVWWGPEDWTVNALPDGLWAADMYGVMATAGVDAAASWALMNPYPPGRGDFGLLSPNKKPYVIGDAARLFSRHFGERLVRGSSSTPRLSTYASLSRDRQTLYVLLVNKSPDTDITTTFRLDGFRPRGDAAAWILDGPTTPTHLFDYGIRRGLVEGIKRSGFTWTVPSYSAVALEIPAASNHDSFGPGPDLARGKHASASSAAFRGDDMPWHGDAFTADKAVDGAGDTRWASDFFVKRPQWLSVDLGQRQPFDRVELRWDYWSTAYQVQVSDDGTSWRTVADRADATRAEPAPQPVDVITLDRPVTARYVRISMTGRPEESGAATGSSQWTPDAFSLWEVNISLTGR